MNELDLKEVFYEMMLEASESGYLSESLNEDVDASYAIYEVLESYFVENYKSYSVQETVHHVVMGSVPNEDLYDIIAEMVLDESIGSAIATAVHGIGQSIAKKRAQMADKSASKKTEKARSSVSKAGAAASRAKSANRSVEGIKGHFKAALQKSRADKASQKAKGDVAKGKLARDRAASMNKSAEDKAKARENLAKRIDNKISDTKKAVKNKANKAASTIGRIAGKFV